MSSHSQTLGSSSQFKSILDAALSEYKKTTGNDLSDSWLSKELQTCDSVEAVLDIIQHQAEAFNMSRSSDKGLMKWIGSSVHVLFTISSTLGEGVGMALPSAKVVFAGIGVLLAAAKDVRASHDALVDLFERIQFFLKRLGVHTRISPTVDMVEILVKIVAEVLSILSIATKEMQQSRTKTYLKKLVGRTDIEDALKRLDNLTREEVQMAIAQVLKATSELKEGATKVNEVVQRTANNVDEMKVKLDDIKVNLDYIADSLDDIQDNVGDLKDDVGEIKWNQIEQDVRKWFSPPDPSINYNIAREAYQKGTAAWFFNGSIFKEWEFIGSLLWIHGKPGSGKSVLCAAIIKHVISLCDAGLAVLAYFCFDFRDKEKQNIRGFVASLLTQLSAYSEPCCNIIFRLYSTHGKGTRQPSIDVLADCLKEMLQILAQHPVYIIADALDECPDVSGMPTPRETVLGLVEDLVQMQLPSLHLCVTSRPEIDIKDVLEPLAYSAISLHDESGQQKDITDYVSKVVYSDRKMRKWRDGEKKLVVEELSKKADGMFRWVFCQLEVLRHCIPASIRQTLDQLPESLDETYARVLRQISQANQAHAHRMLQCLMVAVRPLRVEELAEVLAFEFDTAHGAVPRYRADWRPNDQLQAVLSTCSSLIAIVDDHGSQVVQFSHFTVKEFLMSRRLTSRDLSQYYLLPGPAHTIFAQACLGFLLHLGNHLDETVKGSPLAEYAAEHWVTHAQFKNVASHVKDGMVSLFDSDKHHFAAWVGIYDIDKVFQWESSSTIPTPLYHSSLCGFSDLVEHLAIKCPQHVNAIGGRYEFPLLAALHKKHIRVAEILLKHGANINIRGKGEQTPLHKTITDVDAVQFILNHGAAVNCRRYDLRTPLHLAVDYRKLEVAQVLLEHKADVNSQDNDGNTPLHLLFGTFGFMVSKQVDLALDIARLLVQHGADVNMRKKNDWTPLHSAAFWEELEVAQVLLDRGANTIAENGEGETPLHLVSGGQYGSREHGVDIARLLLERGVDVNARKKNKATPLHSAAIRGQLEVSQVLLDHGANPNAENDHGETPLHLVSQHTHISQEHGIGIAWLLLERGVDVNARTKEKATPLHSAASWGRLEIAQILLDHGANPNAENDHGETPFHLVSGGQYGSREHDVDIARLLLERGADVNARRKDKATPLHSAAFMGRLEIAQLLLDHGANPNAEYERGETPLHLVSRRTHISQEHGVSIARLLLERGVDVNARTKDKATPLQSAAFWGRLEIARVLLDYGANPTVENDEGETPLHLVSGGQYDSREHGVDIARLLLERGVDVNARKKNKATPLHIAALWGKLEIAQVLLDHGANPNAENDHGETPLHLVSRHTHISQEHGIGIARLLLERGVDVDARKKDKATPLHSAAFWGRLEIAQVLLDRCANPNAENVHGETPLHLVSRAKDISQEHGVDIARLLLERGVYVNARRKDKATPLHAAAFWGRFKIAQVLLDHGANPNMDYDEGETLLHLVSRGKYISQEYGVSIARLLLGRGVDIHASDKDQNTPLHSASHLGRLEIVRVLLDHGANANSANDRAHTPLHLVSQGSHWFQDDGLGVAKLLLERGADLNAHDKDHATPLHLACYRGLLDIARVLLDYGENAQVESGK